LAWLPIFYQYISTHSEGAQPLLVRLMSEIECHALLATVQIGECEAVVRPAFGSKVWPLPAARVTLGWFDLDDLSPKVSKDARAELIRATGEVENTQVTESVRRLCVSHVLCHAREEDMLRLWYAAV